MNFPESLLYTQDHEWYNPADGSVGITDFAQRELGDIVFIDVKTVGKSLKQGEVFGTIEAVKTVSDLYLPIDAEIIAFNSSLNDAPETVNNDAYGQGWLVKIKPADGANTTHLLKADQYRATLNL